MCSFCWPNDLVPPMRHNRPFEASEYSHEDLMKFSERFYCVSISGFLLKLDLSVILRPNLTCWFLLNENLTNSGLRERRHDERRRDSFASISESERKNYCANYITGRT